MSKQLKLLVDAVDEFLRRLDDEIRFRPHVERERIASLSNALDRVRTQVSLHPQGLNIDFPGKKSKPIKKGGGK